MSVRFGQWLIKLSLLALIVSACSGGSPQPYTPPGGEAGATATPFQPLPPGTLFAPDDLPTALLESPTPPPAPLPPATQPPPTEPPPAPQTPTLWLDPRLPPALRQSFVPPPGIELSPTPENAVLRLEIGTSDPATYWIYALVAPFPTIADGVSFDVLLRSWRGEAVGPFAGRPLLMDEGTRASLSVLWGPPADQAVQTLAGEQLLNQAWADGKAWGIVPFEVLEPRWKVLAVDGQSPLRKGFDPAAYALAAPISIAGPGDLVAAYRPALTPAGNRDPQKMTVLAMTGVTALVRATAFAMEQKGVLYPGRDIGDYLLEADLTHISNEVPFARDCPYPNPVQAGMRFCSDTRYIKLLEAVGTDIVELTGDHFQDWGAEAMRYTLGMYRERGWAYYGGGANLNEARRAITLEHNGNRMAFIGCNAKGLARAGTSQPGAATCGYDFMKEQIARLRSEGYLPIATFQHYEYYTYPPQGNQVRDFRQMAQAGAVVVSGSQAHQPQAFDFQGPALIHYGLGNLFFDQYDVSLAARQGFIDQHIFYDRRYISTELLTHLFVDYARPRPMTTSERENLLIKVFRASGW
jgi:poly-gamma-glutamate synthesis protein (capsule biosynthesis protein)